MHFSTLPFGLITNSQVKAKKTHQHSQGIFSSRLAPRPHKNLRSLNNSCFDAFTSLQDTISSSTDKLFDNRNDIKKAIMNLNDFVTAVEILEREAMEDV